MLVYIVSFPFVLWFIVYKVLKWVLPRNGSVFKRMCEVGVFLWVWAIAVLLEAILGNDVIWLVLVGCLTVFPLNAIWQRYRHDEVVFTTMFVHGWRLLFLILVPIQFVVLSVGIVLEMTR